MDNLNWAHPWCDELYYKHRSGFVGRVDRPIGKPETQIHWATELLVYYIMDKWAQLPHGKTGRLFSSHSLLPTTSYPTRLASVLAFTNYYTNGVIFPTGGVATLSTTPQMDNLFLIKKMMKWWQFLNNFRWSW